MKVTSLLTRSLLACGTVASVAFAADRMDKTSDKPSASDKAKMAASGQYQRIPERTVDQAFTVKDYIGKTVLDSNGETLGKIADLNLGAMSNLRAGAPNTAAERTARSQNDSSSSGNNDRSAMDKVSDAMQTSTGSPVAYISVGGFMGVGSDYVSVPLSALSWNQEKESFALQTTKADFIQIARAEVEEARDAAAGRAVDRAANATDRAIDRTANAADRAADRTANAADRAADRTANAADRGTYSRPNSMENAAERASTSVSDETQRIWQKLRSDSALAREAAGVNVDVRENEVVLTGTVSSNDQKRKIVNLADEASEKRIVDRIEVRNR